MQCYTKTQHFNPVDGIIKTYRNVRACRHGSVPRRLEKWFLSWLKWFLHKLNTLYFRFPSEGFGSFNSVAGGSGRRWQPVEMLPCNPRTANTFFCVWRQTGKDLLASELLQDLQWHQNYLKAKCAFFEWWNTKIPFKWIETTTSSSWGV